MAVNAGDKYMVLFAAKARGYPTACLHILVKDTRRRDDVCLCRRKDFMWIDIINYTLIRLAVTLRIYMDERGLVFSPSFPDPALIDLGPRSALGLAVWSSVRACRSPGHENVAKHRDGRGHLEANGRHGRFQHPLIAYPNRCQTE